MHFEIMVKYLAKSMLFRDPSFKIVFVEFDHVRSSVDLSVLQRFVGFLRATHCERIFAKLILSED
jgi:hypothetical protein